MDFVAAASAGLTFNAPLGADRAADLIQRLTPDAAGWTALDLGCGKGELLRRLCSAHGIEGDGVDQSAGVSTQTVRLHQTDAAQWEHPADIVLNVGARHIWDSLPRALAALRRLTRHRLLFADAIYEAPPGDKVREIFGDLPDLAELVRQAVAADLRPLHIATSTQAEWDDFESDWRAGIERLGTPEALAFADERREEYLSGYRGVVGFAFLLLTPFPG
jgi:SAM-dependent methyltransferase